MERAYACADEEMNGAENRNVKSHKVPGNRNDACDQRAYEDDVDQHGQKLYFGGRVPKVVEGSMLPEPDTITK